MAAVLDPELLVVYLFAAGALVLSPGPDTIYVLTRSIGDGRSAGVASAAGVGVGVLVHTVAAVVGLSALFRASDVAFAAVTYLGAAYLAYLGVRTVRDDGTLAVSKEPSDSSPANPFVEAVAVNVLNPPVALFFLAFLPQFVDSDGPVAIQLFLLGLVYAGLTVVYLGSVAVGSSSVRDLLADRPAVADAIRWLTGLVLVGLGLRLLASGLLG